MRKKLPKAIGQTMDDLRRRKPNTCDETKSTRVALASIPSPVAGMRAGDVLAEEVRHRLENRRGTVNQRKKLALVRPTKGEAGSTKTDASDIAVRKPEKSVGSD
jgi:hypothetical protein